ncbi:hypothetical protein [Marinimicrobium sp. ABcell2]|uniref:hypothetical protein n=1 Tax=Marinimicrobium sp. ABcell2 TaxID=3069751 RepID=UPI0027B39FBE|nr:hypothetical protein [Marinimicrobium sp. ABcell2]MDQ2077990.1 hypothetical protein [Marinimicrobium sp. ABcell2]
MQRIKIVVFACFLLVVLVGVFSQRHALACEAVGLTGYEQVAPNVFVSPSVENIEEVLRSILDGRQRVDTTFGEMIAIPKIVIVGNKVEASNFGANSTARAYYTPMGSCIILGPKGQNVDVAAHELVHAEVGQRVGWLTHWLDIPVWFNEGVALIVDHRKPFLIENIDISQEAIDSVKQLKTGREFFGGTNTHENYVASRMAVNNFDPLQLYEKLERVRNGESFENVFEM